MNASDAMITFSENYTYIRGIADCYEKFYDSGSTLSRVNKVAGEILQDSPFSKMSNVLTIRDALEGVNNLRNYDGKSTRRYKSNDAFQFFNNIISNDIFMSYNNLSEDDQRMVLQYLVAISAYNTFQEIKNCDVSIRYDYFIKYKTLINRLASKSFNPKYFDKEYMSGFDIGRTVFYNFVPLATLLASNPLIGLGILFISRGGYALCNDCEKDNSVKEAIENLKDGKVTPDNYSKSEIYAEQLIFIIERLFYHKGSDESYLSKIMELMNNSNTKKISPCASFLLKFKDNVVANIDEALYHQAGQPLFAAALQKQENSNNYQDISLTFHD